MIRGVGTRAELNTQLKKLNAQSSHIVTLPCGKTFDLTNPYGTPFGMLDDVYGADAANAMKTHGGPYELWHFSNKWTYFDEPFWNRSSLYRVKPAPIVETITRDGWASDEGIAFGRPWANDDVAVIVTYTRTNGKINNDSYRVVAK